MNNYSNNNLEKEISRNINRWIIKYDKWQIIYDKCNDILFKLNNVKNLIKLSENKKIKMI